MAIRRKHLTIMGVAGLGVVLLGVLAMLVLPWKIEVGRRLTQMLEDKGFASVKLTLSDVGFRRARLQDISIGEDSPLVLKSLDVDYNARDLWRGRLREVTLHGLELEAVKTNDQWSVIGLENLQGATDASKTFALPVSRDDFAFLPFDVMNAADSTVHVVSDAWQVSMPVTATLDKSADPKIALNADQVHGKAGSITIETGKAEVKGQVDAAARTWRGTWKLDDVALSGQSVEIPVLQGAGTIMASAGQILVNGAFNSADKAYALSFVLDVHVDGSAPSILTIQSAKMPWKGGQISLKDEKIQLDKPTPLRLDLHVEKVDVNDLMQALTGKKLTATGQFSGNIPVVIGKDGSLSFPEGGLSTVGPGTISMPPEAIPGEGEKLDLVRNILKDFQYVKFSLGINGIDGKGLSVVLALEGNNPEVENGRLVKLNVNLTGDLLDFIRQNAMLFNDPKALLKQSSDDKKN
jgi:hypothetical protein